MLKYAISKNYKTLKLQISYQISTYIPPLEFLRHSISKNHIFLLYVQSEF